MSAAPAHIRAATRGDLPEVVDLLNACDVVEIGRPDTSTDDVEADWAGDGFDLARDTWVAEAADGRLMGYAYAGDQFRTGELEGDAWVHPDAAFAELAPRLLGLVERRAGELAAERGYASASLDVYCCDASHAKRDLLRRRGYALRRTIYRMAAELGDQVAAAAAPEGLEIRTFDPETDIVVMRDTMNEAFVDHFQQSSEPLDAWTLRLLGHAAFDPALWFLAWDGGEPAGALIAYDYGEQGWVQGLGVRRPWRGRGLGAALLGHAFAAFARRGLRLVELGVDAEGETRPLGFYERAGMQLTHAYELYEKKLAG